MHFYTSNFDLSSEINHLMTPLTPLYRYQMAHHYSVQLVFDSNSSIDKPLLSSTTHSSDILVPYYSRCDSLKLFLKPPLDGATICATLLKCTILPLDGATVGTVRGSSQNGHQMAPRSRLASVRLRRLRERLATLTQPLDDTCVPLHDARGLCVAVDGLLRRTLYL